MYEPVRGYRRDDGTPVRPYTRRSRRKNAGKLPQAPRPSSQRAKRVTLVVTATVALGGVAWAASASLGGGAGGAATGGSAAGSGGADGASAQASPPEVRIDLDATKAALVASGWDTNLTIRFNKGCAANSYGQVQKFFAAHPCRWMDRAYLALGGGGRNAAIVAISWVDMPTAALAEQYQALDSKYGTGNVTELSTVVGPYTGVKFSGQYYASGRDGAAIWNAEVQPTATLSAQAIAKILHDSRQ